VCCNFPETLKYLPQEKAVLTGSPIRQELFSGDRSRALGFCGFTEKEKPVILIIGGSSGSRAINNAVRELLPTLLKTYNIIHLCGNGNLDDTLTQTAGYLQLEYAGKELADLFALADLVISRAGANAICELLALRKLNILIPLSAAASRGDQILNANSFQAQGFSYVLEEEKLSSETLLQSISSVFENKASYIKAMENSSSQNAIETILGLILEACEHTKKK
jgi:UDP-N-acetylglucosamine--N-acetylmuramyl-(pentapeptide) pyrophosphoryl-undecaprenol N-acetylglucosamine transferase